MLPLNSKESVLLSFLKYLSDSEISYCVVGNTESLPSIIPGDIDIVIDSNRFFDFELDVRKYCHSNSIKLVQVLTHEYSAKYFVLAFDVGHCYEFIHPDVCSDYRVNGLLMLESQAILSGRRIALNERGESKGFYVASADIELIYYLIKKIHKLSCSSEQFQYLKTQYDKAPEKSIEIISNHFSTLTTELVSSAISNCDYEFFLKNMVVFKKELLDRKNITLSERCREVRRVMARFTRPTGLTVALLGVDGAGKTTVGEGFINAMQPAFRGVKRYHLRPDSFASRDKSDEPVIDPHGSEPRGVVASVTKLLFFILDYAIGSLSWGILMKRRSHLIVSDRYFHDLLVDPIRYRYGAPMWLAKLASCLVPAPDLFIVFDASAEIVQTRKREVSFDETLRQREAYLSFAKSKQNCIVVDTAVGIDESVRKTNEAVLNYLEIRQLGRLQGNSK